VTSSDAELIAEAREYGDAMVGGEGENWTRLVGLTWRLADALEAATKEVDETLYQHASMAGELERLAPRVVSSVAELDALPKFTVLVDNRWDLWRVIEPGHGTRFDGREFGRWTNAPWRMLEGVRGIFPFWVVWVPGNGPYSTDAAPVVGTGETGAEPTADPDVCPECGNHKIANDSHAMSHEKWCEFLLWHAGETGRNTE
jgi:hypothetical protein